MRPLDELGSPELSALVRLAARGPVSLRGFSHAARAGPVGAKRAHDRLVRLGLLESVETPQGAARVRRIVVSARGRAVARHLEAIEALLPPRAG